MKPLILWARDKHPTPYTLRIGARAGDLVRGNIQIDGEWLPFTYDRKRRVITLGEGEQTRYIRINEWGWEQ